MRVMSLISVFPLILQVSSLRNCTHQGQYDVCPKLCKCSEKKETMVCSNKGKKLSYIPAIPSYVRKLTLDNNFFPRLRRSTFCNLSSTYLSELRMRGSKIMNFDNDTFVDLENLKSLDLEANRRMNYTSLKSSFSSLGRGNLSFINLSKTGLVSKEMSLEIFAGINGIPVDEVSLRNNYIKDLSKGSLRGLNNVRKFTISYNILEECYTAFLELQQVDFLDMENNKIRICDTLNLPIKIKELKMNRNKLERVPKFCSSLNKTRVPMLRSLHLDQNEIGYIEQSSFYCLNTLNYLKLSGNKIRRFSQFVFKALQGLQILHLNDLKEDIISINEGAFSLPNLTKFLFQGNSYNFRPLPKARKASLKNSTNLEILDLSKNKIPVSEVAIKVLLGGLSKLRILRLINVGWYKVPDSFLKLFPMLEELSLSHNSIAQLKDGQFSNALQIKLLRLDANGITYVGPNTFPEFFWRTVHILDLTGNPFACTCDLLWFRDTLRQSHIVFHEYPQKYVCRSPDKRKGQLLSQFDLSIEDCKEKSVIAIAMISFTLSLVFVFLVVLTLYRFRWQIRYFIYLWRYKEPRQINKDREDFTYDAFVIYPEEDSDFVHDILLPKLENENNLRVCIHPRDFQPGKSIIENIVECIANSKRVFAVISQNFNQSKWCNFELLIAQDRWLNNEASVPLIIMRQEVDNSWIKREIRALVKTTTYAKWTEDDCGQELFWHQIITSVKDG